VRVLTSLNLNEDGEELVQVKVKFSLVVTRAWDGATSRFKSWSGSNTHKPPSHAMWPYTVPLLHQSVI